MKSGLPILFFVLVSLSSCWEVVNTLRCHRNDMEALMSFRGEITDDTSATLGSWRGRDCCNGWKGVGCDFNTGRVVGLDLQGDKWDEVVYLSGTISESIGNLPFLNVLRLSQWKNITGRIPSSICKLSNLVVLKLDGNNLSGTIPDCIGTLSHLKYLTLSRNQLSGQIPESIGQLGNVVKININENLLVGQIPLSIGKLKNLTDLGLQNNHLSGPIPFTIGSVQSLKRLYLGNNMFTGRIPSSLGDLPDLLALSLRGNQLYGDIASSLGKIPRLQSLTLSGNLLTGSIPHSLCNLLSLISLDLSRNNLVDVVPKCLENLWNLVSLDLSRNKLSELLPSIKVKDTPFYLDLSYNNFHLGTIPRWITESPYIYCLHLASCGIKMTISEWKPVAPESYISLDLSNNQISGDATDLFKQMTELKQVNLSYNDLQYNLSTYSAESMLSLDLHSNKLYGTIENVLKSFGHGCGAGGCLKYVDLSKTMVSGEFPRLTISQLNLKWLNIASNNLGGAIPASIGLLNKLEHLDLSKNAFMGYIPMEMLAMKKLNYLDVSYNQLCKEIPQGEPFSRFPPSSFFQNNCLCGSPLHGCKN